MNRRRIPTSLKRRQDRERLQLLALSQGYEKRLATARTRAIHQALRQAVKNPPSEWASAASESLNENYLQRMLERLYLASGKSNHERIVEQFTAVPKADKELWEIYYEQFVRTQAAKKVVIVSGTLKEELRKIVEQLLLEMDDYGYTGIEKMTQEIFKGVDAWWAGAKEWQCRRIMQTETMVSMATAGYETVRQLGVPCYKVWSTSGLDNTRDAHLAAEGQTVKMDEPFVVDGELLMYPHDESLGASAGNIINCACDCIYLPE